MITKREAAIISAYTGYMLGDFDYMHEYIEKVMGRPVFTHEMGSADFVKVLNEKTKADFGNLEIESE